MNEPLPPLSGNTSPTTHPLINKVQHLYQAFSLIDVDKLGEIYHDNILFQDPFHQVKGLTALKLYFERLYTNVNTCRFEFHQQDVVNNKAFLTWTMHLEHPKLNRGRAIYVEGISELCLQDRIVAHRDYFDGGQMLYEHLPLLGCVVRHIKKRL